MKPLRKSSVIRYSSSVSNYPAFDSLIFSSIIDSLLIKVYPIGWSKNPPVEVNLTITT